jgi:hypothetical protein
MNDRELVHAALLWHAAHLRRISIGAAKRKLNAALKATGYSSSDAWGLRRQEGVTARQLTEAKRLELAAMRKLAGACAAQRERFNVADVIDGDGSIRLLRCDE